MRSLQPGILINNRLGSVDPTDGSDGEQMDGGLGAGESRILGDYGTPEHAIIPDGAGRAWESCQTSIWRLWGHTHGQRWKSPCRLA